MIKDGRVQRDIRREEAGIITRILDKNALRLLDLKKFLICQSDISKKNNGVMLRGKFMFLLSKTFKA